MSEPATSTVARTSTVSRRGSAWVIAGIVLVGVVVAFALWTQRDDSPGGERLVEGTQSQGLVGDPGGNEPADGGPLNTHPATGYFVPGGSESVSEFTDAYDVLTIDGDEPITLRAVESIGEPGEEADAQMRLLDARLSGPQRRSNFQFFPRHAPLPGALGDLTDFEDATIGETARDRDRGYALILTYEASGTEPTARSGLRVIYESGGQTYEQTLPSRIIYCGQMGQADCDKYSIEMFPEG